MSNWTTIEVSSLLMLFATQMPVFLGLLWATVLVFIIFFGPRIHPIFDDAIDRPD